MSDTTPDPNAAWSTEEVANADGPTSEELAEIKSMLPIIVDIIAWFDEQIAGFLNPNVIADVRTNSDPEEVKRAVLFAQKMSRGYSKKRVEFAKRFEQYLVTPKEPATEE